MPKKYKQVAVELTAPMGKLDRDMRKGVAIVRKRSREAQRAANRMSAATAGRGAGRTSPMAGALGGARQRMGGMVKGAIAFGGVYGAAQELQKAKAFEEVLVDLAVRGKKSRQWLDATRKSMIATSNEFGIGKAQLAEYVGTVIDLTGDTELAIGTLKSMTAVAYSANVPMKALAGTVVEMQSKLALAPKEFEKALGILASQADVGKVPLSQMANILPEILNASAAFGHKGIPALRDYGAVLQMAARGAGTLFEAKTAMNRALDQMIAKREKIEKTLGVDLKVNNQWLSLGEIMKRVSGRLADVQKMGGRLEIVGKKGKKTMVDVEKWVIDIFGVRGKKAILPMLQQARIGFGQRVGAVGGKGGLTSFEQLRATGGAETIAERVALKRKLSPELEAWNRETVKLRNRLHKHLLPLLGKIGKMMPAMGKGAGFLLDNWKLILALWTGNKMRMFFNQLRQTGGIGGARGVGGVGAGGRGGFVSMGAGGAAAGGRRRVGGGRTVPAPRPGMGLGRMGMGAAGMGAGALIATQKNADMGDIASAGMMASFNPAMMAAAAFYQATKRRGKDRASYFQGIDPRDVIGDVGKAAGGSASLRRQIEFAQRLDKLRTQNKDKLSTVKNYSLEQIRKMNPEQIRDLRARAQKTASQQRALSILARQEGGAIKGLTKEDVAATMPKLDMVVQLLKKIEAATLLKQALTIVDPSKTPAGVTESRRNVK